MRKNSSLQLDLEQEKKEFAALYDKIQSAAGSVDKTLLKHVKALLNRCPKKDRRAGEKNAEGREEKI